MPVRSEGLGTTEKSASAQGVAGSSVLSIAVRFLAPSDHINDGTATAVPPFNAWLLRRPEH